MMVNWHERFLHQSSWTENIRDYLLQNIPFTKDTMLLETGSGSGVILSDLTSKKPGQFVGIDNDFERCVMSTRNYRNIHINNADVYSLPFPAFSFDLVICHYFLLWLTNPNSALQEIYRVLKPGGFFLAFAEPDYSRRVDLPRPLDSLGKLQVKSLQSQGVNTIAGKELPSQIAHIGFHLQKFGVTGYEHPIPGIPNWWESEWQVLEHDLLPYLSVEKISTYKELDRVNWLSGNRVLWVPTSYALSQKL
jgi:SAM-dependent methyltransferase